MLLFNNCWFTEWNAQIAGLFFSRGKFLHAQLLLTHFCLWWGREQRGGRGERQGNHHTPFRDGQAPIIPSSTPLLLLWVGAHNWTFVLCVNSSPAHTFPDCVRPPNRWGLYAADTHVHTLPTNVHSHSASDHRTRHTPMPDPSHAPLTKKSDTITREAWRVPLNPWIPGSKTHRTFNNVFCNWDVWRHWARMHHFLEKGDRERQRSKVYCLAFPWLCSHYWTLW